MVETFATQPRRPLTDMTALTINRTYLPTGTTGQMSGTPRPYSTVELAWANNAPDKSCVPEGTYDLIPYDSPTHGPTWYLSNAALGVGGAGAARSFCELHAANYPRQLLGCIAAGLEGAPMFDPASGEVSPAVEDSRPAIAQLLEDLGPMTAGHTLEITSASGPPST